MAPTRLKCSDSLRQGRHHIIPPSTVFKLDRNRKCLPKHLSEYLAGKDKSHKVDVASESDDCSRRTHYSFASQKWGADKFHNMSHDHK